MYIVYDIMNNMDTYFSRKQQFEVKNILMMDLFLANTQLFASQDVSWWTGLVWITFYQLFELILTAPKIINSVIKEDSLKNDGN